MPHKYAAGGMRVAEKEAPAGRHNVTVHGGGKLASIKQTGTGVEVNIGEAEPGAPPDAASVGGVSDIVPPWLQDQLPEAEKMTLTDLNKLNEQVKHQGTMNRVDVFSQNPQGAYIIDRRA